jgi:hypothetical protein
VALMVCRQLVVLDVHVRACFALEAQLSSAMSLLLATVSAMETGMRARRPSSWIISSLCIYT